MGSDLISLLNLHRLSIDSENEKFASNFVNIEGYKVSLSKKKVLLNTWYDGYLFSLWIGIKFNRRKSNFKLKDKANRGWGSRSDQYIYLISNILSKKEILIELNLDSRKSILENKVNVQSLSNNLKRISDEFAFGGLDYLKELYEKNDEIFDSTEYFESIIEDLNLNN